MPKDAVPSRSTPRSLGARSMSDSGFNRLDRRSGLRARPGTSKFPPPAAPVASATKDQVLELDSEIFGGNRSGLLEMLMRGHSRSHLVTRQTAGRLNGFLFVQDRLIGPGAAASPETVRDLIQDAMVDSSPEQTLLLPSESAYLDVLLSLGFVEQQRLTHMRHGDQRIGGRRHQLLAQTSFAAG